jgi:deazaflavin-dependent oxidoreductase (nitroreductase family)
MPLPRALARANRVGLNRVMRRVAPRLPGFGLLTHRGRRSGREFRTPINLFAHGGGYRIALTYGADADWVRNVLAAGECTVVTRGRTLRLTDPRLVVDRTRTGIPAPARVVLGVIDVQQFLDLAVPRPGPDGPVPG